MILTSQGFWLPKAGSSEADYEDAIAIGPAAVAIADGATESSFARAWARALTEGFVCEPLSPNPDLTELMARIGPMQKQWHAGIAWDRLPWFAEDKARSGAFAALLTLRFEEALASDVVPPEGESADVAASCRRWHALAIGDTCLFQIRDETLYLAFPLADSAAFDSTPLLLSSNPARNLQVWDHAEALAGTFKPGDRLLLMTDALAKWFLSEVEAGNKPWQTLCALNDQTEFAELTSLLRAAHRLKNDDTSLICIQETLVSPRLVSETEEPPRWVVESGEPSAGPVLEASMPTVETTAAEPTEGGDGAGIESPTPDEVISAEAVQDALEEEAI